MKKIKIIYKIIPVFILFFWSCNDNTDFEETKELDTASKLLSNIKQENVTLDEVKNDNYLDPILQKTSKNIQQNKNTFKNSNYQFFNLNLSNQVKKYTLNDYVSYTIPIINESENSFIFQNIVIEKDILRDAVYLVTYYPDANYKESIQKHLTDINSNIDFTGSKKIEYLYYKRKINIDEKKPTNNMGKNTVEIDEPITICVETYTPKKCTAGGNHSPGESCNGSSGQQPGWIVSEKCTSIPSPQPPGPGSDPGCVGCVESGPSSESSGIYYSPSNVNSNWKPQFICVSQGPTGCNKVVPYTPILTIPIYDIYNYYANVFNRQNIDLLTRFEYAATRTAIDEYLETHKTSNGGYTVETVNLVNNVLNAVKNNSSVFLDEFTTIDVRASLRSPMNIDRSAIDNTTTEGIKFNTIYNALTTSPEFQKLFINIFNNNSRFNVKFQIAEHVYEGNNPTKREVNAITTQIPGSNNITILINKQILIPSTSKSQITIENAKTILHESIHAYLFVKANNPSTGADFVKILNSMYPTVNEQHDFMYNKMIPTMQTVLSEIRDLVTISNGRSEVNDLKIYTKKDNSTFEIWNWINYYKFISINGLEEATCFKIDFPKDSNELYYLGNYIIGGKTWLK